MTGHCSPFELMSNLSTASDTACIDMCLTAPIGALSKGDACSCRSPALTLGIIESGLEQCCPLPAERPFPRKTHSLLDKESRTCIKVVFLINAIRQTLDTYSHIASGQSQPRPGATEPVNFRPGGTHGCIRTGSGGSAGIAAGSDAHTPSSLHRYPYPNQYLTVRLRRTGRRDMIGKGLRVWMAIIAGCALSAQRIEDTSNEQRPSRRRLLAVGGILEMMPLHSRSSRSVPPMTDSRPQFSERPERF
jgi:hypothetical protein